MNDKTGGPAFPRDHHSDGHNGMTLRDRENPMDVDNAIQRTATGMVHRLRG